MTDPTDAVAESAAKLRAAEPTTPVIHIPHIGEDSEGRGEWTLDEGSKGIIIYFNPEVFQASVIRFDPQLNQLDRVVIIRR